MARPKVQRDVETVRAWLVEAVAEHTGLAPEQIETDRAIMEFGIGSRQLVELSGGLARVVGGAVDPALLFSYPSIG